MGKCLAQCIHITRNQLRLVEPNSLGEARMSGEYFKANEKEDDCVFFHKMIFRINFLGLAHIFVNNF